MTAVTQAPSAARQEAGEPGRGRAVLALARFEALRLLLHPLVFVALAGYLVFLLWPGSPREDSFPVLQDVDRETQIGMELIGLAALVSANMTALRSRRHGTDAHFDVLVLRPWHRTLAHLLSVLPLTVLCAVIVTGQIWQAAAQPGAVGHASVGELAAGPLSVLVLGSAGILLARTFRSPFAAPLLAVALIAVMFVFVASAASTPWLGWLTPIAFEEGAAPLPSDLLGRPAGWHALYLVATSVLVGTAAALLSGGRHTVLKATAAGSIALTVAAAVLQGTGPSPEVEALRKEATERPSGLQECERHGPTTYCAFPEFLPWADEWDAVVRGVRGLVPDEVAERPLSARQRVYATKGAGWSGISPNAPVTSWAADDRAAGTPDALPLSTAWGSAEGELSLAAAAAVTLVTGSPAPPAAGVMCNGQGVLVVWLATQATPRTAQGLDDSPGHRRGDSILIAMPASTLMDAGYVTVRAHESAVVEALLDKPRDEVAERVAASWQELTAKETSTVRAAELLGVQAPPLTDDDRQYGCA